MQRRAPATLPSSPPGRRSPRNRDRGPARARVRAPAAPVAVLAAAASLAACGGGPSASDAPDLRADDAPVESRDGVGVDGARYPFVAAIGEIWGAAGDWPTHYNLDFTLTDGRFAVTPILADGENASVREPVGASAVLRAELYAPEETAFPFAVYEHVAEPDASGAIAGRHFFVGGRLGVDADGSGEVEPDEMRDVIGGTIEFDGPVPNLSLTFELVLEDGAQASGSYRGLFEFIPLN